MKNDALCLTALVLEALALVALAIAVTAVTTPHLPEGDPSLGLLWMTFLYPRSTTLFTI